MPDKTLARLVPDPAFVFEEKRMDFVKDDVRVLYRKYLTASLGSALVMSIYSFVDTIAVGQSEGAPAAAAMAIVTPLYGVIVFLAILCGIGGSVLMTNAKGEGNEEKGNAYFTASLLVMAVLTVISWIMFSLFYVWIFTFFGADMVLMPTVMKYARWIIWFFPVFLAPTFIGSFIRNDGAPGLAMAAVIIGGCLNMFGDWFFVFPMGMGMSGAGLATVIGTSLQTLIMCGHFFRKSCRLRLARPHNMGKAVRKIFRVGFGASVLDLGVVAISIMMNNQAIKYGGTIALAVYGVIAAVGSLFQALFSGVGQTIQPLVSANCGAGRHDRMDTFWRMGLRTALALGLFFTALGEILPVQLVGLFVKLTPQLAAAAPGFVRRYYIVYPFMGVTVLATYYLQSAMCEGMSLFVAVLRSFVLSALFIYGLPLLLGLDGVWLALPCSECLVTIAAFMCVAVSRDRR